MGDPQPSARRRMADVEDALADAEHGVEHRMHGIAEAMPVPAAMHEGADQISRNGDRHRRRAAALRNEADQPDS